MMKQKGAAILMAMLTVALVASLSAAALWQQWRGVELETAERSRVQAAWILQGALDWARLILREDARTAGADHLAEPWAIALQEARLSTFLAAQAGQTPQEEGLESAFLSGQMTDMQSHLNAINLVQDGKTDPISLRTFARLFEALRLPEDELVALSSNLLRALKTDTKPGNANAPGSDAFLVPTTLDQLAWMGLSEKTIESLRPYVTVLPDRTPVNINTAPELVLFASIPKASKADAQRLASTRTLRHFNTLAEANKLLGSLENPLVDGSHSVGSRFFEVRGQLRLGERVVQERSLVQREGPRVKVLWRQRGVLPTLASLQ